MRVRPWMGVAIIAIGCSGQTSHNPGAGGHAGMTNGTGGASGGSAQAGASSVDCSLVGCAPAPLCSIGCTETCGCCGCIPGDIQGDLICEGGCYVELCAPPPSLTAPEASEFCPVTNPCDPDVPASGSCYNLPSYTSMPQSVSIWIDDAASGGESLRLLPGQPVTVASHTYELGIETLIGTGAHGMDGDIAITVDGQPQQIQFHLEGFGRYLDNGVWEWDAAISTTNAGCAGCSSSTGRHFSVGRTGPDCPPYGDGSYTFSADGPPRSCGSGVDLIELVLPGP